MPILSAVFIISSGLQSMPKEITVVKGSPHPNLFLSLSSWKFFF